MAKKNDPQSENRQKLNVALDEVTLERDLASDPFPRARPLEAHDQAAEYEAKEAARTAQREEHNARGRGEA